MRLLYDIYICVYFGASWTTNKQKSVIRICAMMWHSLFTLAMRFVIGCRNGRPIATETVWRLLHGGRCRGTLQYLQAGGQSAHCNRTTACGEERMTVTGHFHPKFPLLSPPQKNYHLAFRLRLWLRLCAIAAAVPPRLEDGSFSYSTLHNSVQLWQTVTFNTVRCPCNGLVREVSP